MEIGLETFVKWFESSTDSTRSARVMSEKCRDYYDGIQLTAHQIAELKRRKQPPVVFNRIQPKVDFLLGVERQSRTDPKAYPRTPNHDDAANAATDGIRYVCDNENFDVKSSDVFENELIEGYGGVSVEVDPKTLDPTIKRFAWDRYFFDPHSRERDFSDARYDGIVIWMDFDEAKERWGDKAKALEAWAHIEAQGETYDDKPTNKLWFDKDRKRLMVVQMNYLHKGKWHRCVFTGGVMIEDPELSPYVNELGEPENPLIKQSAKVDRELNRYGAVRNLLDIQDEINKRRSKALHILNTKQTWSKKGALANINRFKAEANKPDGHLEYPQNGEFGKDFGVVPNDGMAASQFQMYQESINQMDSVSANAAMAGDVPQGASGKAIGRLQQGGMIELAPLFDGHSQWKKRVYRAVWSRIKQFWDEEKWIRVTDNEDNLKWVGLNAQVSQAEKMIMDNSGMKLADIRSNYGKELDQIVRSNPQLGRIVETANDVAQIDVDIILEEVPDVTNLQSEQFDLLVKMYQANPNGIPWEEVVEMSTLRNKGRITGKDDPEKAAAAQQVAQTQQMLAQLEAGKTQSEIEKNQATTEKTRQEATQKQIENALILSNPTATQVVI